MRRTAPWLLVACWLVLLGPVLPAQAPAVAPSAAVATEDLAALLAPIRERHAVPALGAAVLVDGRLRALGVTGIRRVGHEEAVTVDDRWHLGSDTKAMTATLLARFVEAGKLQWTTTVGEALPDLAPAMHEGARAITLQQLLTHRAGLPASPPSDLWSELFSWKGTTTAARLEVCKRLLADAPAAAPGQRFLYSNASYMIAGAIAERVGGASWEELLRREVWTPLGIDSGGFGMPGVADATTQPWGHRKRGGSVVAEFGDNPAALGPAGTAHMTLRDWAKFAALHLGEPLADGKSLLAAETLTALHTPPQGDYAGGWGVAKRPWAEGPVLTHAGSNTMWMCVAWLAPAAKFGVLVTCNQGDTMKACDDVAAACIERFRKFAK